MKKHIVPPVRNICILFFCALACDSIDEVSWSVNGSHDVVGCVSYYSLCLCKHHSISISMVRTPGLITKAAHAVIVIPGWLDMGRQQSLAMQMQYSRWGVILQVFLHH